MASYVPVVKNGANGLIMYIGLVSQANTKVFQSNPTLAAGDFNLSKDGGAFNALGTTPSVAPASSKMVKVTLSNTECNADNLTIVCSDAAGAEWCDRIINVQTVARQIDDLAFPQTSGRGMIVDTNGAVDSNLTRILGTLLTETAGLLAGGFKKFFNVASPTGTLNSIPDALPAAVNGLLTAPTTANVGLSDLSRILGTALSETAGLLAGGFKKFFNVAAPTGTLNSIPDAVPGAANGLLIAGANAGTITFGAFTVTGVFSINGVSNVAQTGDSFARIGALGAGLTDLAPSATALSNLVWTNAKAAFVDVAISTRATPTQVNAEVVDALFVDTYGEPAQGTPPELASLAYKISYGYKQAVNKKTQTTSEFDLFNYAGTVVDQKSATSDVAGTVTRGQAVSGP